MNKKPATKLASLSLVTYWQASLTCYLLASFAYLLLVTKPPVYAQPLLPCVTSGQNQGLISAESITGASFGSSDQTCVVDPQANYRSFNTPSYDSLEKEFYHSSKSPDKKSAPKPEGDQVFNGNGIYLQPTSMRVSSATNNNTPGVQIIFVQGNLYIQGNINYADPASGSPTIDSYSGLVFIVRDNININYNVTKVNAVLISGGEICTAYDGSNDYCLTGSGIPYTPPLTINGSLISLNKLNLPAMQPAIKFTRNLANNIQPAEVINKQAKFLYILKNGLLTKDLILTQEDRSYTIPSPVPSPSAPPPSPGPSACPGANPLVVNSSPMPVVANCIIGI